MRLLQSKMPIYKFVHPQFRVCFLLTLCALCGQSTAQDFKTVHDGIEYAEVTRKIGDDPVKLHLLRLDLKKVRLDVHHAMDAAIGTEKTSSIATRHGAIAAINAGFFRLDKSEFAGDAASSLMIDGELLSEGMNDRVLLEIDNKSKRSDVYIHHFNVWPWFVVMNSYHFYSLSGVNRERTKDEAVLFTSKFGPSTLTEANGTEIVFSDCLRSKGKNRFWIHCEEMQSFANRGNSVIPRNGYVLSMSPGEYQQKGLILKAIDFYRSSKKGKFKLGFYDEFVFRGLGFSPSKTTDVVAGVPQLIKNSKIDITWEQEKASKSFVETRHPRTAVAKLKDGKFLMITVDGRQPGVSVGMNLNELAAYLLELGAVEAMNLDGGGSTTMFLDGRVVNKPSDKEGERKVGDAILVTLRKK